MIAVYLDGQLIELYQLSENTLANETVQEELLRRYEGLNMTWAVVGREMLPDTVH